VNKDKDNVLREKIQQLQLARARHVEAIAAIDRLLLQYERGGSIVNDGISVFEKPDGAGDLDPPASPQGLA
jgi:hypothetical protein